MFIFSKYHHTHFCHWRSLDCFFFMIEILRNHVLRHLSVKCHQILMNWNQSHSLSKLSTRYQQILRQLTNCSAYPSLLSMLARFLSIARVLTVGIEIDNMRPGSHCNCQLYCKSWRKCNKGQTIYLHCDKRSFISDIQELLKNNGGTKYG